MNKRCPKCETEKPREAFYKSKSTKDGFTVYCKECSSKDSLSWYYRRSVRTRREHVIRKYGLTIDRYEELLTLQGGVCAICKADMGSRATVDHCHKTGKVRGVLCGNCNAGLGQFKDNTETLAQAIAYLKATSGPVRQKDQLILQGA